MLQQPISTTSQPEEISSRRTKIVIINGGSLYCLNLLQSIAQHAQQLRGSHIILVDTQQEDLELVYTLGKKLFAQGEADLTLEQVQSEEDAIDDADFVLTAFPTDELAAQRLDETLPLRHQTIGHPGVGPGGFFYALRNASVLAGLATEIEKVAPQAFLLNYAAPNAIATEAITYASGIRVIGIHQKPGNELQEMMQAMHQPHPAHLKVSPRVIGLDQGSWTTAVWQNGIDTLPQIVRWCEEYVDQHPEMTEETYARIMLATLTAHYQAIPSHTMHYYHYPERVLEFLRVHKNTTTQQAMSDIELMRRYYQKEAQAEHVTWRKVQSDYRAGEFVLTILLAILHNKGQEWVLSVPNTGAIGFLENDRVVEIPCYVDARGAIPFVQGNGGVKLDQRGLLAQLAEYQGAAARAALWGTRRDAIKALAANPLVMSYSKAEAIYDDMAAAHADKIPERLRN